jgi:glycosyltransferase involved in cell wall biosynthesis
MMLSKNNYLSPFFSIIIPVNCVNKNFFTECINSIQNQSFSDYEIIIVFDDDSFSDTEIQGFDSYFHFIKVDPCALGHKRNIGIKAASGEFIVFCDHDDLLQSDFFSESKNYIERYGCDFILFNYTRDLTKLVNGESDEKIIEQKEIKTLILGKNFYIPLSQSQKESFGPWTLGGAWAKVYSKKVISDNNLLFCNEHFLGEDQVFVLKYCHYSKKICVKDTGAYYYWRENPNSTMSANKGITILLCFNRYINESIKALDEIHSEHLVETFKRGALSFLLHRIYQCAEKNSVFALSSVLRKTFMNKSLLSEMAKNHSDYHFSGKIMRPFYLLVSKRLYFLSSLLIKSHLTYLLYKKH